MSKIKNDRLTLDMAKCKALTGSAVKGLILSVTLYISMIKTFVWMLYFAHALQKLVTAVRGSAS